MARTQYEGPVVVGGRNVSTPGNNYTPSYNPDFGPSLFVAGFGLADPRWQYSENNNSICMIGFQGMNSIPCLDQVPSTASATVLAAAQAGTTGVALTLNTTSGGGALAQITSATTMYPSLNVISSGIALDGLPGLLAYGQNNAINIYDPAKALSRAVVATWAGNDTSANLLVKGYDLYGYPQTEKLAGASGTTVSGKKAWKFITGATPGGTVSGSNISLGTLDIFGFPLRADKFAYVDMYWNSALGTATGFTYASNVTATSTTGDVRGTTAPGTSNGTISIQLFVTPSPDNMGASNIQTPATVAVAMFGQVPG